MNFDHSPILLILSLLNNKTDWNHFRYKLEKDNILLKTREQLDEEAVNFIDTIQKAAWESTPVIFPRTKGHNYLKRSGSLFPTNVNCGKLGNRPEIR